MRFYINRKFLGTVLLQMIHFRLSSLGCLLVDKGIFSVIFLSLTERAGREIAIAVAIVMARIISGHCNYFYNRHCVFKAGGGRGMHSTGALLLF